MYQHLMKILIRLYDSDTRLQHDINTSCSEDKKILKGTILENNEHT